MTRIRGRDTLPERMVTESLFRRGLSWESHSGDLPGRPDIVFREARVAVFIDGDFWHGWHFSFWKDKLSEFWEIKIQRNKERDRKNHRRLRRLVWKVIRLWEHQIHSDIEKATARVLAAIRIEA